MERLAQLLRGDHIGGLVRNFRIYGWHNRKIQRGFDISNIVLAGSNIGTASSRRLIARHWTIERCQSILYTIKGSATIPDNLCEEDGENGGLENLSRTELCDSEATYGMRTITGQVSGNDCHLPSQPESRRCYDQGPFDGHSIGSTPLVIAAGHRIMLVHSQSPGLSFEHTGPSIVTKKIRKSRAAIITTAAILGTTITIIHHDQIHYTASSAQTRPRLHGSTLTHPR